MRIARSNYGARDAKMTYVVLRKPVHLVKLGTLDAHAQRGRSSSG